MIFTLDNFEGPLSLLLFLTQKQEIDIFEVSLQKIMEQALQLLQSRGLDDGAEIVGAASTLLLLKSRSLLPPPEISPSEEDINSDDLRFDLVHQLIDYCRFKDVAKLLTVREEQQGVLYERGHSEQLDPKRAWESIICHSRTSRPCFNNYYLRPLRKEKISMKMCGWLPIKSSSFNSYFKLRKKSPFSSYLLLRSAVRS